MNPTFLYLGGIYFGSVWIGRRLGFPFPWKVALLFYLLVVAFLFPSLVLPYVNLPVDHVLGLYPWRGFYEPSRSGNPETNDVILQIAPWAHQVRESWKSFEAPLWNDAAGGGYPLLANGQSSALALFRILALPLDLGRSLTFEAGIKLLVALSFTFLYLRRQNRATVPCLIASISFGFSTFLMIWLHFPLASVAAFLPALFYALDLVLERPSYRRILFFAGVLALMLLHGHPETVAHAVFIGALYVLFALFRRSVGWKTRFRQLSALLAGGVLAVLLSLPFLLPFLEALPRSKRYDMIRAHAETAPSVKLSHAPSLAMSFLQPRFYGSVQEHKLWGPGTAEFISGYAGIFGVVGWFAVLFYNFRWRRWNHPSTFWLGASALLVPLALEVPGVSSLVDSLPVYSMAANGRLRAGVCWFLALLAGETVHLLRQEQARRPVILAIVVVAALFSIIVITTRYPGTSHLVHGLRTSAPMVIVLLCAVLTLTRSSGTAASWRMLVAAILLDLWIFGWYWNPSYPARYLYPETPLITELQRREGSPERGEIVPHRIAGTTAAFFPNTAAIYGLEDIRAHDPMAFGRVLGALRVFTGYTSEKYFGFLGGIDDPFLDYLNVRYVVTAPQEIYESDRFIPVYSGSDGRIYKNRDALPRFYAARNVFTEFDDVKRTQMILENRDWANSVVLKRLPTRLIDRIRGDLFNPRPPDAPVATVRILSSKSDEFHLSVDAPRWTLVIGSQPNWPGWKIFRGSERLKQIEVNGAFMAFLVPPGKSNVRLVYAPRSFSVGVKISLATAAALAGALVWQAFRRRKL